MEIRTGIAIVLASLALTACSERGDGTSAALKADPRGAATAIEIVASAPGSSAEAAPISET